LGKKKKIFSFYCFFFFPDSNNFEAQRKKKGPFPFPVLKNTSYSAEIIQQRQQLTKIIILQ
jgi:hypothetical protein